MESIKFNAKGHSVEFSKRTLTIDNKEYSYTGISQIKHSSAYHAYLFRYKGEWVKLFYEEPQGKTIAALFKRINAMNARRAMQARATQSIDTAAIAAALAGEEEKPAEPKVEESAKPDIEAEKPAEEPKVEEPVEPAPAEKPTTEKPVAEKPAEKPVKEKKPKFWSRKKKAAAVEEKPAEEPAEVAEEPKVEPVEEPVVAEPVEESKVEPVAVEPPTVEIPEEPVEVPGESVTVEPPTIEIPEEALPDAVEPKLELPEVEETPSETTEAPEETVGAPAEATEAAAETKEPAAEAEEVLAKAEEAALKKSRLKKAFTIFAIIIALFVIAGIIYFFTIGTTNDSSQTVNTDETYQYNDIDELIEEMQE